MFKNFQNKFKISSDIENQVIKMTNVPFKYTELLLACGGKTYENGIYTIHTFENSMKWTELLKGYFPKLEFDFISFGHDWLGRQFCVPIGIGEYILVLDPATQEDGHMDMNLIEFNDTFIVDNKNEFFITEYFQEILNHLTIEEISFNKCLGLKTSLFLGGEENIYNYSLYDLELYWDVENQLFRQVSKLPSTTSVNKVLINPFIDSNNQNR
ncbi:hypothetical protein [Pedobacter sp. MW01-1-1]|uniref:hypothetical protein n=1 Tax=Pedobacter sp. MW01-1-1 TaxID=3383027 RepID=UPI003FEDA835